MADRGVAARVEAATWRGICEAMEADFRAGDFTGGALAGLDAITAPLRGLQAAL